MPFYRSIETVRGSAHPDKIHAHGMDSLTDQERDHLLVLRDRLRRR